MAYETFCAQAESRAHDAEQQVQNLQKEVDRIEGMVNFYFYQWIIVILIF